MSTPDAAAPTPRPPEAPDSRMVRIEQSLVALVLAAGFVYSQTWTLLVALTIVGLAALGPYSPTRALVSLGLAARQATPAPVADPRALALGQYGELALLLAAVLAWVLGSPAVAGLLGIPVVIVAAIGAAFTGWPLPPRKRARRR